MDFLLAVFIATTTKNVRTINLYTRMLRNDNDFGLWQNIRSHKNKDREVRYTNANLYDQMYNVYRALGRLLLDNLHGHRVRSIGRRLYKRWNKLFVKQDSK